jgi:GAF domain-containing protein
MQLCKLFCNAEEKKPYAVFDDVRQLDVFKDQLVVTEGPQIRFLACVPLRSHLYDLVIGTFIVVDDKPRDGLSNDELEFLVDMGVTVMDYLEAQRNTRKQHRSERMLKVSEFLLLSSLLAILNRGRLSVYSLRVNRH